MSFGNSVVRCAILILFSASCKAPRKQDSGVKDVVYVDGTLADRFTFVEVCTGPWPSTPDTGCKIRRIANGATEKEVPSEKVYRALKLPEPAGDLGAAEVIRKQARVDQIGPAGARIEAQRVLDAIKASIDKKNNLKSNLEVGTTGATCFKDENGVSAIGSSGVTCAQLEALVADDGILWEPVDESCLVEVSEGRGRDRVLAISMELKRARLTDSSGATPFREFAFVDLRDLNGTCPFLFR